MEKGKNYLPDADEKRIIMHSACGKSDIEISLELDANIQWLPPLVPGEKRKMPADKIYHKNKKWVTNTNRALYDKMGLDNMKAVIAVCLLSQFITEKDFLAIELSAVCLAAENLRQLSESFKQMQSDKQQRQLRLFQND